MVVHDMKARPPCKCSGDIVASYPHPDPACPWYKIAREYESATAPGGEPEPDVWRVEWHPSGYISWVELALYTEEHQAHGVAEDINRGGYRTRVVPLYRGTPIVYEPASQQEAPDA